MLENVCYLGLHFELYVLHNKISLLTEQEQEQEGFATESKCIPWTYFSGVQTLRAEPALRTHVEIYSICHGNGRNPHFVMKYFCILFDQPVN